MKMTRIPIPSTLVKLGRVWTLFDSAFNMPRMQHVGENSRDWGITDIGTLWLRCYAKHALGYQYKFRYFERADGRKKFIVERCFSKARRERISGDDAAFDIVREYLIERAARTKITIEKRKARATVYCNKPRKEKP